MVFESTISLEYRGHFRLLDPLDVLYIFSSFAFTLKKLRITPSFKNLYIGVIIPFSPLGLLNYFIQDFLCYKFSKSYPIVMMITKSSTHCCCTCFFSSIGIRCHQQQYLSIHLIQNIRRYHTIRVDALLMKLSHYKCHT